MGELHTLPTMDIMDGIFHSHSLHSSLNIVRVITSRRMRWVRHVACMGKGRGEVFTGFWLGGLKGRDH
jgi:hypothetical protein